MDCGNTAPPVTTVPNQKGITMKHIGNKGTLIWTSACAIVALCGTQASAQSSTATIKQSGNQSTISTDQISAESASVTVEQIGDRLLANVVQRDAAHKAELRMDGSDNSANVVQSGLGHNELGVDITGSMNSVSANQFAELGGTNSANILQNGVGNQAMIQQQAAVGQNYLTLAQNGNGNVADLSQTGGDNQLDLTQNGDANNAVLSQDGVGLILGIIQNGGATTVVNQSGPGGGGG